MWNTRKYMKYQEIQDQKHEILGNTLLKTRYFGTLVFLRDSCLTWVFLLTGCWTILLFLLGYSKCQSLCKYEWKEISPKVWIWNLNWLANLVGWNVRTISRMVYLVRFFLELQSSGKFKGNDDCITFIHQNHFIVFLYVFL
jgi:hypothetical protein